MCEEQKHEINKRWRQKRKQEKEKRRTLTGKTARMPGPGSGGPRRRREGVLEWDSALVWLLLEICYWALYRPMWSNENLQ